MEGFLIAFGLLVLGALVIDLFCGYWRYRAKQAPRDGALAEASHGAAMIVLAVLGFLRFGEYLPSWFTLAMLALLIVGALWLFNGAKFSVGWRDPKLIARAWLKIGLAGLVFWWAHNQQIGSVAGALLPLLGWFLLVTGATKLFLVLRGFPDAPWDGQHPPATPHGKAPFVNPIDTAKGLKK